MFLLKNIEELVTWLRGRMLAYYSQSPGLYSQHNMKIKPKEATVAQAGNPTYLGGRDCEYCRFEASLGKKFKKYHLNHWLGVGVHACHPNYAGKHK
jgi:hypothetical protein